MSSNKDTLIGGVLTGYDVEGTRLQDVQNQISKVASQISQTQASPVTIPQPGSPFYLGIATTKKGRVRAQFDALLPANTETLITKIVQTSLRTNATIFNNNIIEDTYTVDPDALAANGYNIGYIFKPFLETLVQYDLIQLIAVTGTNTRAKNPQTVAFNQVALAQFTTAAFANGPSPPSLTAVVVNQLDPGTKTHDAEFTLRVYSPLTIANTAQNWPQAFVDGKVHCALIEGTLVTQIKRKILATDLLTDPASPIVPNRGYIDISKKKVTPGTQIQWTENVLVVSGETLSSGINVVGFTAGNVGISVQNLTGVNLAFQAGPPNDPKHEKMSLEFIQPTPAVALKNVSVNMKVHGTPDASYVAIVTHHSLRLAEYHAPGSYTVAANTAIVLKQSLKMIPGVTYDFQLILKVIGNANYLDIHTGLPPVFTVTAGANPDVPADTGPPTIVLTPLLQIHPHNSVHISNMIVASNFNTPADPCKELVFTDGFSFFDLPTYFSSGRTTIQSTTEANARWPFGHKAKEQLSIRLKDLKQWSGTGNLIAYWYAFNLNFGASLASPNSNTIILSQPASFLGQSDQVTVVDSGVIMNSPSQVLQNGSCGYADPSDGTGNTLRYWQQTRAANAPITPFSAIAQWDKANHQIKYISNADAISQAIGKRWDAGEFLSFYFLASSNTTLPVTLFISILNNLGAANEDITYSQPTVITTLTAGVPQIVTGTMKFNTLVLSRQWFAIQTPTFLSPGAYIILSKFRADRGKVPFSYAPKPQYETGLAGTEDYDASPIPTAVAQPDLGNPTNGLQGGFPNLGGIMRIGTF